MVQREIAAQGILESVEGVVLCSAPAPRHPLAQERVEGLGGGGVADCEAAAEVEHAQAGPELAHVARRGHRANGLRFGGSDLHAGCRHVDAEELNAVACEQ